MSAIRPDMPALPASVPGSNPAIRDAQAAFFRAALGGVQATVAAAPLATMPATPAPRAVDPDRPARPGSLLDIRV